MGADDAPAFLLPLALLILIDLFSSGRAILLDFLAPPVYKVLAIVVRFRFSLGLRCFFGALVLALCSTTSVTAGGVTIITHGFNSNVTDWIIPMAGKIPGYPGFPGATYSCYEISITRNGSGLYVYRGLFSRRNNSTPDGFGRDSRQAGLVHALEPWRAFDHDDRHDGGERLVGRRI